MSNHTPPPPGPRRFEYLERRLDALETRANQPAGRTALLVPPRHIRLARTCEDYGGGYPVAPCTVYPIVFLDGSYDKEAGEQTPTLSVRSGTRQEYAYCEAGGRYFTEGELLHVAEQNEHWWILGAAPRFALVELSGTWVVAEPPNCHVPPLEPLYSQDDEPLTSQTGLPLYANAEDAPELMTWPKMAECPVIRFFCDDTSYSPGDEPTTLDVWHPLAYPPELRDEVQALHKLTGKFPAKLGCIYESGSSDAWAWVILNPTSGLYELLETYEDIWRFELQEELSRGGWADAKLVFTPHAGGDTWDTVDLTFEVNDTMRLVGLNNFVAGSRKVPAGTRGYAKYFADAETWQIIALEPVQQKALHIRVTLAGTLTTSTASVASCSVAAYCQGASPGSTVTVYNQPASSNYVFSGASGATALCYYDPEGDKYWIYQVEC